jgi:hypothetical protein
MRFRPVILGSLLALTVHASRDASALGPIDAEEAVAIAVNDLSRTASGYRLEHPRHTVLFEGDGVTFRPRRGGPEWHWSFDAAASTTAGSTDPGALPETRGDGDRRISYFRGFLEERYLFGSNHVEQQFVLPDPIPLHGADLVIEGKVRCDGRLERCDQGWIWRTNAGVVSIGDVRVYDASGRDLSASLTVWPSGTRIVVDGVALALAEYPVTIDPEIGTNDFRVSDLGLDGDLTYDAQFSAVAYDPIDNQYLVVWEGDGDAAGLGDGQFEIFGQRIDAATGVEIGANDFRLSDMGPDGNPDFDATSPAVAFNPANREYLVVWTGDDLSGPLANGESEIFGQRIDAGTGAEVGVNDFRLSDMGPDGDPLYDAVAPAVAYGATQGEYLVVWEGDDDSGALVEGETEIFAQRVQASTGLEVGANDFRVSDMGPDGDPLYDAGAPAIAYGGGPNEYLVVWEGDDNGGGMLDGEVEIFGQRVSAATGLEAGANDFRLSDMGPNGSALYDALAPAVAYASGEGEYLVVWSGDDNVGGVTEGEFEIFGQRINAATGVETGTNDFRLSEMGPDGDPLFDGLAPSVTYNPTAHEYFVVWFGDNSGSGLGEGELEIFGQGISAVTGAETGANDARLSDVGTDGVVQSAALHPAIAFGVAQGQYFVTWEGDDDALGLADDEFEVWGQRILASNGSETGVNDFRLSQMGPDGDIDYDADLPAVAYDPDHHEYLIVWQGDDDLGPLVDGETEIFCQRIDALVGRELGRNDLRISDMGPDGDPAYDAQSPAVVYDHIHQEYLVVWAGEDNNGTLANGEFEIFGQRIDAATGAEVGANDFRISDMGPDGDPLFDAGEPALVYNPTADEYLVVWAGDDNAAPLVEGETEIFGQRLSGATGADVGANDFRLSDMGPDGNFDFDAAVPAVAFNSAANQYLVVWAGEDNTGLLVNGEFEIYGQLLNVSGSAFGTNDFRISDMGGDGDSNFDAFAPCVAHDPFTNQYLVVWEGEDNVLPLAAGEFEIFAQRIDGASGAPLGANDFRVSDMGPDGDPLYDAQAPAVVFNGRDREYLVLWHGDDNSGLLADGETEIFGQRLIAATGLETGENDFRLSDMGPDGDGLFDALQPALVYAEPINEYLIAWIGDDDAPGLGPNEFEVYGQRFLTVPTADVAENGIHPVGPAIDAVHPNPASGISHVGVYVTGPGPVNLTLFDVQGRAVARRSETASGTGLVSMEIDTTELPNGVYLARVATDRGSDTRRVVVTR